jgi:hypothetical protein
MSHHPTVLKDDLEYYRDLIVKGGIAVDSAWYSFGSNIYS